MKNNLITLTLLGVLLAPSIKAGVTLGGGTARDSERVRSEGRSFTMPSDSEVQAYDEAQLGNMIRRRFASGLGTSDVQLKSMVTSVEKWVGAHSGLFDAKQTADLEKARSGNGNKQQSMYTYLRTVADSIAHNAALKGGITTPDSLNYPTDFVGSTDEKVKAWITLTLTSTRADYKKVDQLFDRLNTFEGERFPSGTAYDRKVVVSRRDISQGGGTKDANQRKIDHLFLVLEGLRKQPRQS